MKINVGTCLSFSIFQITCVWGSTPSTPDTTKTAPSKTLIALSTSAEKSTWPGVSINWTILSFKGKVTSEALTDIPRSLSTDKLSVVVSPWSTLPVLFFTFVW